MNEHNTLFSKLADIAPQVVKAGELILQTIKSSHKILVCGNGGSAADAQHFAAEFIGRFETERKALPAIALTVDTSILTALGNDYGYDTIFSRQIEGIGLPGDTMIGISTSGNSKNVLLAVEAAKRRGVKSIGLLGRDGGKLAPIVDIPIIIPHPVTARIQEAHIFIIHFWASFVEREISPAARLQGAADVM
ncbi:MAG: D-sedoheptulose 7-phosphate isomerase [Nitrospirota bacterium]